MSYHLLRELEQLPSLLEKLEEEIDQLQSQVSDAEFFNQSHVVTQKVLTELSEKEQTLETAFERWQELETLKNG